ncbi:MAG: ferredoxin [Pseudonocardiaceae bacterium]
MRVTVDRELCIGAGNCARIAPKVFQLDDEEVAIVIDPTGAAADLLRRAAKSCPSGAIVVHDDHQ